MGLSLTERSLLHVALGAAAAVAALLLFKLIGTWLLFIIIVAAFGFEELWYFPRMFCGVRWLGEMPTNLKYSWTRADGIHSIQLRKKGYIDLVTKAGGAGLLFLIVKLFF